MSNCNSLVIRLMLLATLLNNHLHRISSVFLCHLQSLPLYNNYNEALSLEGIVRIGMGQDYYPFCYQCD